MIEYYALQEAVYNYLSGRRKKDSSFRFSLRKSFTEATINNYFIGTEKSKYFGFSLWYIPASYPGASIDPLVYIFNVDDGIAYLKLQLLQTNSPRNEENEVALKMVKEITKKLKNLEDKGYELIEGKTSNKMYMSELLQLPRELKSEKEVIDAIEKILDDTRDIIDAVINELQKEYPDWIGENISEENFQYMLDHLKKKRSTIMEAPQKGFSHSEPELNQIIFGPPGTGKTFSTINEAVRIVNPEYYELHKNDRDKLREEYQRLLIRDWDDKSGRIAFCTFHQSYSYEDFVEGIKPETTEDNQVIYKIEDGIFKRLCQRSHDESKSLQLKKEGLVEMSEKEYKQAFFYKISLGDINNPDDKEIYEHCIKNNVIAIGFGDQQDFSGLSESEIANKVKELDQDPFNAQMLNYFIHYLQKDNYVVISKGTKYVRALGKVVGDYEYIKESPIRYNHFRKVEWIFTNEEVPVDELYERNLSQQTMYKLDSTAIRKDFFVQEGSTVHHDQDTSEGKYVMIIDEINRGNVSSIFGELITLLEPDKRKDRKEELELMLPYSKEPFSVPDNVYVIGTMNTADRSIEALDTALRRRFTFLGKPSNPSIIQEFGVSEGIVGEIDLVGLLTVINDRIEKLIDKDHCIGHAYFMSVETLDDLKAVFTNKVIPLLEEYFFGDLGKMGLVLGRSFVQLKQETEDFEFAHFDQYDSSVIDDLKHRSVYTINVPEEEEGFISVYLS